MKNRGLTLLEVVVASSILAVLSLVILTAEVQLSDTSAIQGATLDMDRDAARFMTQLRRELRQSGYESGGTPRVRARIGAAGGAVVAGDTLELYVRLGPDGIANPWRPSGAPFGGANNWIAYETSPAVAGRRTISRRENGGAPTRLIQNVQSVTYTLQPNSTSVRVRLVLVRSGTKAVGGAAPPDLVRTYEDQISMMNLYN